MYKRADRRDPRSVRASCCEMTAMQCVSCPPDGIRVGRTRPGGQFFCYGSGTDANANASCDEASERVIASLCMPCKVLDKTTEVPEQSRSVGLMVLYPGYPVCVSCFLDSMSCVHGRGRRWDWPIGGMMRSCGGVG